ncbi:efflux RND transporter periplasmic adaptor subunit [Dyella sp.]|uniref:efflux RND transporter periplasmic adaptor subunit n=1 Tax=Dyella sp. TaxID=1869338 RepID=UPI002D7961E4|nr:efflux RND transporter periplasmic adaptor subunit [Dyella sp.]HET7329336.1 efflux RND transporter periplasmic adaptor subunit [Dyella sp.]
MDLRSRRKPGYGPRTSIALRAFALALPASFFTCAPAISQAANDAYECLIEPAQMVELGAPVSGLIDKVLVKRGDRVSRGQVLASLDSHAEQAAADLAHYKSQLVGPTQLAQSKIEFSQRKFERRRDMAAEKLMSRQDSDDAESELKQAQAELVTAKENREQARLEFVQQSAQLNLRTLRSPFDGVVVDQMMWPGEIFEPSSTKHAILKLAQINPLHVRVVMPMRAFGEASPGMSATIVPEILQNQHYAAKVTGVDRIIDAASGTFVVFIDLPNPKFDLPSGVKCKATLNK